MSQVEIARQQIAGHNYAAHGAEILQKGPSNVGNRNGQGVVQDTDSTSQIADMAEEAGMGIAHKRAQRGMDKATFLKKMARAGQATQLDALTKVKSAYEKLPNMPSMEKLRGLVKKIQSFERGLLAGGQGSGGGLTGAERRAEAVRTLLAMIQGFNQDITHQYAALQVLREFVEKRKKKQVSASGKELDLAELLEEVEAQFQTPEAARAVQAGFAAAQIAAETAKPLGTDPASIRDMYRNLLREERNYGQLYDALLKFDMENKQEDVTDAFIRIVGNDLSNVGPHTDPVFLRALLTELGKLKKMKTVGESAKEVVEHVEASARVNHDEEAEVYATEITSGILHLTCRPSVSVSDVKKLGELIRTKDPRTLLVYFNDILMLHDSVPDEVFPEKARLQQKTILRKYITDIVESEEEKAALEAAATGGADLEEEGLKLYPSEESHTTPPPGFW